MVGKFWLKPELEFRSKIQCMSIFNSNTKWWTFIESNYRIFEQECLLWMFKFKIEIKYSNQKFPQKYIWVKKNSFNLFFKINLFMFRWIFEQKSYFLKYEWQLLNMQASIGYNQMIDLKININLQAKFSFVNFWITNWIDFNF